MACCDVARASAEQAEGVDQVNKALTQMDEVTQQNSALVEENAATAKSLEQQAAAMSEQVGTFRLAADDTVAPVQRARAAAHVRTAAPKPRPVAAKQLAPRVPRTRARPPHSDVRRVHKGIWPAAEIIGLSGGLPARAISAQKFPNIFQMQFIRGRNTPGPRWGARRVP